MKRKTFYSSPEAELLEINLKTNCLLSASSGIASADDAEDPQDIEIDW